MSEQEERDRRVVRLEKEEDQDEVEGHRRRIAATEEAQSDDETEDVEAHRKKV
jgi:hypothetical protein